MATTKSACGDDEVKTRRAATVQISTLLSERRQGSLQFLVKAMLEAENWAIALELYKRHPIPALLLAHQLAAINQCLQRGKKGIPDAIAGLDLAIDGLYPHTDFHKVSHRLYLRRLEGTLKFGREEKLRQLGVKL